MRVKAHAWVATELASLTPVVEAHLEGAMLALVQVALAMELELSVVPAVVPTPQLARHTQKAWLACRLAACTFPAAGLGTFPAAEKEGTYSAVGLGTSPAVGMEACLVETCLVAEETAVASFVAVLVPVDSQLTTCFHESFAKNLKEIVFPPMDPGQLSVGWVGLHHLVDQVPHCQHQPSLPAWHSAFALVPDSAFALRARSWEMAKVVCYYH